MYTADIHLFISHVFTYILYCTNNSCFVRYGQEINEEEKGTIFWELGTA